MQTELAKQLDIEFPIFAFTHCRDVVAAVSKAGGFGVLGAVGFSPEQLEVELAWIDEHVGDKPYGVDIVIPGKYEGMGELDPEKKGQKKRHDDLGSDEARAQEEVDNTRMEARAELRGRKVRRGHGDRRPHPGPDRLAAGIRGSATNVAS